MSCGGSAKNNANQAVVQAVCADSQGKVTTREAADKFHELSAEHGARLRLAKIAAVKRPLNLVELKDVTQEAHAYARKELPRAVEDLTANRSRMEQANAQQAAAGCTTWTVEVGHTSRRPVEPDQHTSRVRVAAATSGDAEAIAAVMSMHPAPPQWDKHGRRLHGEEWAAWTPQMPTSTTIIDWDE